MNTTITNTKKKAKKYSNIPEKHNKTYSATDYRFLHQHINIDDLDDVLLKAPKLMYWHAKKNIVEDMNDETTINIVVSSDDTDIDHINE
jgi:hypothetical protein